MSLIKKLIVLGIVIIVVIGVLLWFSIIPFPLQDSSNSSYTSLTLRDGMNSTATLEFGDTEYSFTYYYGLGLRVSTFIELSKSYTPYKGDTYRDLGIELKVSDVTSDYISNYIVILVKPTVQDYMASLHYTRVNITLNQLKFVNISSGLVNETHQYGFLYSQINHPTMYEPKLTIHSDNGEKTYDVIASGSAFWSSNIKDFNIETTVFKIESGYMIIYVKPLY